MGKAKSAAPIFDPYLTRHAADRRTGSTYTERRQAETLDMLRWRRLLRTAAQMMAEINNKRGDSDGKK